MSLDAIYGDWRLYNGLVIEAVRRMSIEELALRAGSDDETTSASWPIWAIAGHTAGTRVYWLCDVMGMPGAETTPFPAAASVGWEDDLRRPRSSEELVGAWTTTWAIVERALTGWTPRMLDRSVAIAVGRQEGAPHYTRRSLILRLITHEAYHVGQIAVIQGIHRRPQIDLWPPRYHTVEAATARGSH